MKIGDLVKTKVSILNNRIVENRLGLVIDIESMSFPEYKYNIVKVRFAGEPDYWSYKEEHLELVSEGR